MVPVPTDVGIPLHHGLELALGLDEPVLTDVQFGEERVSAQARRLELDGLLEHLFGFRSTVAGRAVGARGEDQDVAVAAARLEGFFDGGDGRRGASGSQLDLHEAGQRLEVVARELSCLEVRRHGPAAVLPPASCCAASRFRTGGAFGNSFCSESSSVFASAFLPWTSRMRTLSARATGCCGWMASACCTYDRASLTSPDLRCSDARATWAANGCGNLLEHLL